MKFLTTILATLGSIVAATATMGSMIGYFDEPEMPESLL